MPQARKIGARERGMYPYGMVCTRKSSSWTPSRMWIGLVGAVARRGTNNGNSNGLCVLRALVL